MQACKHNVLIPLIASFALMAALLSGCVGTPAPDTDSEQAQNRAYMSQVNEVMGDFYDSLTPFVEAVSSGEAVAIRNEANSMNRILDKLSAIEAPEGLASIKEDYDDGTGKLRQALDDYLTLYDEIQTGSFDWTTYDERRELIQNLYNEGVEALEKADADLAEL